MTALMTFLIAASSTREDAPPHKETTYPPHRNHRGELPSAARPRRTIRHLRADPETLDGPTLDTGRLVPGCALHPLTRRRVERVDGQRLRGRHAVPALDVAVGRRPGCALPLRRDRALGVGGFAARAVVPVVSGLASRRRVVAGVGDSSSVRPEVTS